MDNEILYDFYVNHEADFWGGPTGVPLKVKEICFTEHTNGFLTGEAFMRWYVLTGKQEPRLEVFSDGWKMINKVGLMDVLAERDSDTMTADEFVQILKDLRFEDQTPRPLE